MRKPIKVVASGKFIPDRVLTNKDFESMIDTTDEWIQTRTGIKERRIADDLMCSDLATQAAKDAISRYHVNIDTIDLIIVATISGEQKTPSIANNVQKNLGIQREIMSFDVNAACTGFVYALDIASSMLSTNQMNAALVIGSEKLSDYIDYSDRNTSILFGDGAGAVIITTDGIRQASFYNKAKPDSNGVLSVRDKIQMDGKKVYQFAVEIVEKSIHRVLELANLELAKIDRIIPHQANIRIIQSIAKSLDLPLDRFAINIEKYGNTSAASIPILLAEYMAEGHQNETVLIVGFGGGFTYGAAIFTI